jgi:hypothetical protein
MEKCPEKDRANEPNPPRVTPPEPESENVPDDAWLDEEESLLKKLERDDQYPPCPPPPDEDPRCAQSVLACEIAGAAIPGEDGWQLWRGIIA